MYILKSGEVIVFVHGPGGRGTKEIARLRKGNFFGEIALLQNVKRTATIFNDKNRFANVLVLEKRDFDQVAAIFPECVSKIFQKAESRLKELREKEAQEAREHKEKMETNLQLHRAKSIRDTKAAAKKADEEEDDGDEKDKENTKPSAESEDKK